MRGHYGRREFSASIFSLSVEERPLARVEIGRCQGPGALLDLVRGTELLKTMD